MKFNWTLGAKDIEILTVILGGTLLFCVAHYIITAKNFEQIFDSQKKAARQANGYLLSTLSRGVLLGLASIFIANRVGLSLHFLSLSPLPLLKGVGMALGIYVLLIPILIFSAKKPEIQNFYPELRVVPRDRALVINSAAGWFVFLLGYEILFRGLLLQYGIVNWGLWTGVAVMTGLYVLAHLHKSASETFACLVVGPAFAILTLETGTIWAVVVLHALIAITNENLAAKFNPEFQHQE